MERQTWWAAAAVIVTIILAVAGGTWTIGRQMATQENLAELRTEIQAEFRAMRTATDEQMRELRGFIVQHLNGHAQPDD